MAVCRQQGNWCAVQCVMQENVVCVKPAEARMKSKCVGGVSRETGPFPGLHSFRVLMRRLARGRKTATSKFNACPSRGRPKLSHLMSCSRGPGDVLFKTLAPPCSTTDRSKIHADKNLQETGSVLLIIYRGCAL